MYGRYRIVTRLNRYRRKLGEAPGDDLPDGPNYQAQAGHFRFLHTTLRGETGNEANPFLCRWRGGFVRRAATDSKRPGRTPNAKPLTKSRCGVKRSVSAATSLRPTGGRNGASKAKARNKRMPFAPARRGLLLRRPSVGRALAART